MLFHEDRRSTMSIFGQWAFSRQKHESMIRIHDISFVDKPVFKANILMVKLN